MFFLVFRLDSDPTGDRCPQNTDMLSKDLSVSNILTVPQDVNYKGYIGKSSNRAEK